MSRKYLAPKPITNEDLSLSNSLEYLVGRKKQFLEWSIRLMEMKFKWYQFIAKERNRKLILWAFDSEVRLHNTIRTKIKIEGLDVMVL